MPRRLTFDSSKAEAILGAIREGSGRGDAARSGGVCLRTLDNWLARGRDSDQSTPLGSFARRFDAEADRLRRRKLRESAEKAREESKARWQRFKGGRESYWREKLGEELFWRRRLAWATERNAAGAIATASARLREAESAPLAR